MREKQSGFGWDVPYYIIYKEKGGKIYFAGGSAEGSDLRGRNSPSNCSCRRRQENPTLCKSAHIKWCREVPEHKILCPKKSFENCEKSA